MSDIFREIEQEIRRDDALKLWLKFQIPIYVLAALILIGIAGWRYWDYRQQQASEAQGAAYAAALQLAADGKAQQSQNALEALAKGQSGYALLARFSAADAQGAGDPTGAIKAYQAIAADPSAPSLLQELARLRAALLEVSANPGEAEQSLRDLAGPGDPFHASAREQLAILALKRKDFQAAGRWLDMIVADPLAPAALRQRAESLEGLVAGSGVLAPPKSKPAPSAASKESKAAVGPGAASSSPPAGSKASTKVPAKPAGTP
jgi:hypothetical protein